MEVKMKVIYSLSSCFNFLFFAWDTKGAFSKHILGTFSSIINMNEDWGFPASKRTLKYVRNK